MSRTCSSLPKVTDPSLPPLLRKNCGWTHLDLAVDGRSLRAAQERGVLGPGLEDLRQGRRHRRGESLGNPRPLLSSPPETPLAGIRRISSFPISLA